MVSSLLAQLTQSASLNSNRLLQRRKNRESYLFTGRDADEHDLDVIHALGVNGLIQLSSLNHAIRVYEEVLFSHAVKGVDRTLLSADANAELNKNISGLLKLLGPYLMEPPTGKVIEWLVKRFRINEFNVEDVLALFWPYHESPHFAKMLTILHIKEQSTWSFLLAFKSAAQIVPRFSLVTEMLRNSDVSRFITSLLPDAIKGGYVHHTLLAFNAATLSDFIVHSKALDEGTVAFLLPALLEPLQMRSSKDAILGSYILLSTLSQNCRLAPKALKAIVSTMASCAQRVATQQFVNAIVSVCEPQDELDSLPDSTIKSVLRLSGIVVELRKAFVWVGIERFICPMISALGPRMNDETTLSLVQSFVTSPSVPQVILRQTAILLVRQILSAQDSSLGLPSIRQLLSGIHQRHPVVLQKVGESLILEGDEMKAPVEQLLISLSITYPDEGSAGASGDSEIINMIVASSNADVVVRVDALIRLINTLSTNPNVSSSDLDSIHSALLARVQDSSTRVLDALYADPVLITPILTKNTESFINHLMDSLISPGSKPARPLLRTHLTFVASHFCPAVGPSTVGQIFYKIFFPFLLFSKPRHRTAEAVWEIILKSREHGGLGTYELLGGCHSLWEEETDADPVEKMGSLNIALASKIAGNILISDTYSDHLDAILGNLLDADAHKRIFSCLITRALLRLLSGRNQTDAAHKALEVLTREMDSLRLKGLDDFDNLLHDANLAKIVVLKPNSNNTIRCLQTSIVAMIPGIPRPMNAPLDWLANSSPDAGDGGAWTYIKLLRTVYKLAASSAPPLSTNLFETLFTNLQDDSLAFLAGIWTNTSDNEVRRIALGHAIAFLEAHKSKEKSLDFQTILPSLLVVLQSIDAEGKDAVLACISQLVLLTEKRYSSVYGIDTIYGSGSVDLQFLDRDDYKKYLLALLEHKEYLVSDPGYIAVFHQHHLERNKSDKKKESEYKQHVLCYLLSHVNAISSPDVQIVILKIVEHVSDPVKAQLLLPLIQTLVQDSPPKERTARQYGAHLEEITALALSSFDHSISDDVNEPDGTLWPVFVSSMEHCFQSACPSSPRTVLVDRLEQGLFASLSLEHKVELCNVILKSGIKDTKINLDCKNLLVNVLKEGPLIVQLLTSLQPTTDINAPRANKRVKLTESPEDSLSCLTLLAEVLSSKPLPGSLDLISRLLETLGMVVQSPSQTQADLSYLEQLLMSAVENAAGQMAEAPNMTPSAIRLDVLVELIRVANNPQTFHQALLLMASLSRLAPDSVLHNVMPVFTFMGSNIFHRDDSYSFRVVQKTIDSIVPVMASSLKKTHTDRLALYIGSRDFLRIFTDAANHIPRHRRINFFAHLVDVLGPQDFLTPVLMLLLEKVIIRVVRQTGEDFQSTLGLQTSILQHHSMTMQLFTLTELLRECRRLATRVIDPEDLTSTFLEIISDEETGLPSSIVFGRRAQALITFVEHALKSSPSPLPSSSLPSGGSASDLVTLLIDIATARGTPNHERNANAISQAAYSCLSQAVGVMSADDFVGALLAMLESGEEQVESAALDLLADRLPSVPEKVRHEILPTLETITASVQRIIHLHPEGPLPGSAFRALKVIIDNTFPGQESSLANLLPVVLASIKGRKVHASAMPVLAPLIKKFGPRVIPYFREIVTQCVLILREEGPMESSIFNEALNILRALIISIPAFWSAGELTQVVQIYLDHSTLSSNASSTAMLTLIKAIAKQAPAKVLLPTLCEMWPLMGTSPQKGILYRYIGYFNLLKRSLRSSARSSILEYLRPLFKVFLEAFETSPSQGDEAEEQVLNSFLELVVKLNEATFQPLFRRLHDWAFVAEVDHSDERKVTFCRVYASLLDYFKELMTPYMSITLEAFVNILKSYSDLSTDHKRLWSIAIDCLTKCFNFDDGAFWRDDKLRQISPLLIEQVIVCLRLNSSDGKMKLTSCLSAMTDCVNDDALLKAINLDLLMHTRSEDARLRLFALTCSETLWRAHGEKLIGFVSETMAFIAECAEDENDGIVKQTHNLNDAVERAGITVT